MWEAASLSRPWQRRNSLSLVTVYFRLHNPQLCTAAVSQYSARKYTGTFVCVVLFYQSVLIHARLLLWVQFDCVTEWI